MSHAPQKLQVFISSTFTDMQDERAAAVEAVLEAGHIPAGMELFAAGNESQLETIYRWIDDCDAYCLILGGRYGSVEQKSGKSYIELEFDYALKTKTPLFSIVIQAEALERKVKGIGTEVLETDNNKEFKAFKRRVLSHTSSFYSDVKDIKLGILKSLNDKSRDPTLIGWVKANQLADPKILDENRTLRIENEKLKKKSGPVLGVIDLPPLPEISDMVQVTLTRDHYSAQTIRIEGTWSDFFPFFCASLSYSVNDWDSEYYFSVNEVQSRTGFSHAILASLQGFAVPKSFLRVEDFELLKAIYIEVGLMRAGKGDSPFGEIGMSLARRARIQGADLATRFSIVEGELPWKELDDEIPF